MEWGKSDADSDPGGNGVASRICTPQPAFGGLLSNFKMRPHFLLLGWTNAGKDTADAEAQPREFADLLRLNLPLEGAGTAGEGLGDGFEYLLSS
jgi:hypothetical protein